MQPANPLGHYLLLGFSWACVKVILHGLIAEGAH